MRRHAVVSHGPDELGHVVILVGTQGLTSFDRSLYHGFGRFPLRRASSKRGFQINRQTVAVLHHGMAQVAQPELPALFGFLVKPSLRVGGRGVRAVATLFALEVHRRVAPLSCGGLLDPSFAFKLFIEAQASIRVPSPVKCSEDTSPSPFGQPQHLSEKHVFDGKQTRKL